MPQTELPRRSTAQPGQSGFAERSATTAYVSWFRPCASGTRLAHQRHSTSFQRSGWLQKCPLGHQHRASEPAPNPSFEARPNGPSAFALMPILSCGPSCPPQFDRKRGAKPQPMRQCRCFVSVLAAAGIAARPTRLYLNFDSHVFAPVLKCRNLSASLGALLADGSLAFVVALQRGAVADGL